MMVKCSACGKAMDKVPDWMASVSVEFICNNCPNRQTKNIAFINLELDTASTKLPEAAPDVEEIAAEQPKEA